MLHQRTFIPVAQATPEARPQIDPIFDLIEAHRETWAAFGRAITANDEPARRLAGLDTSPETMALMEKARDDASEADFDAWGRVVEARPTTREGIRAWLGYLDETRQHYDAVSDDHDYFGAVREVTQALVDETPVVPFVRNRGDLPTDWSDPPEGFMSFPALAPTHFVAVKLGLPKEALRLFRIAVQEWDRLYLHRQHDPELLLRTRRDLRLDELRAAAFGQAAIDAERGLPAEGEEGAIFNAVGFDYGHAGEITYRDAGGNLHRKAVPEFINFTLQRLAMIAKGEVKRRFDKGCAGLDEEKCEALDERLRHELRADELWALAFGKRTPVVRAAAAE